MKAPEFVLSGKCLETKKLLLERGWMTEKPKGERKFIIIINFFPVCDKIVIGVVCSVNTSNFVWTW